MIRENKELIFVWFCFFTSAGTLLCCTLPMIFVVLGLGATLAALSSHLPWLTTLTAYKFWIFLLSGILLIIAELLMKRPGRVCPTDTTFAKKCQQLIVWNYRILRISQIVWVIGFISSYLALPIKIWLE